MTAHSTEPSAAQAGAVRSSNHQRLLALPVFRISISVFTSSLQADLPN